MAKKYGFEVPALPAAMLAPFAPSPAIHAEDDLSDENVERANSELELVELMFKQQQQQHQGRAGRPSVADLCLARTRKQAILLRHTEESFPSAAMPAWARAMAARLDNIAADIHGIHEGQVWMHNMLARQHNRDAAAGTRWQPILCTLAGPTNGQSAPGFPATGDDVAALTVRQIASLSAFYGETFGTSARDNITAKQEKFRFWATH